ncbi:hypothetical protein COO60DRAFT_1462289 [Scenedesmus sp. NREL 46B-D3]|nr:hypothetical protein COO60DRAFT_1462289 [Scenedesmus sp. NREL 46B-D3]
MKRALVLGFQWLNCSAGMLKPMECAKHTVSSLLWLGACRPILPWWRCTFTLVAAPTAPRHHPADSAPANLDTCPGSLPVASQHAMPATTLDAPSAAALPANAAKEAGPAAALKSALRPRNAPSPARLDERSPPRNGTVTFSQGRRNAAARLPSWMHGQQHKQQQQLSKTECVLLALLSPGALPAVHTSARFAQLPVDFEDEPDVAAAQDNLAHAAAALPDAAAGLSPAPAALNVTPAGLSVAPAGLSVAPAGLSVTPAGLSVAPAGLSVAPAGLSPAGRDA